jgi:quercetin dioxygenase-like cupin family protein
MMQRNWMKTLCLLPVLACITVTALAEEKAYEFRTLAKGSHSWDGTALPAYPDGTPEITVSKIIIAPGAVHPFINAGVVLRGQLTVTTEHGKTLQLGAGDALIEVVHIWHRGKNTGNEPVEIIVFYAGTKDAPVTRLQH